MTLSTDQIDKIRWIVSHCGQQARQMAGQQFQVFEKGVDDYVTTVDRLLDEQLLAAFAALFPEDGVITEENTQSRAVFQQDYRRLWMIDPVDGTDDFIHGRAHYSVMVGLLEAYQPVMGWIYAPVFDRLYYGGAETGLFQVEGSGAPLPLVPTRPVSITDSHCPIIIGDKDRRRYGEAIAQRIPGVQFSSIGSFGLKVMEVVCGQAGLYVYLNGRVKLWDTTGPIAIARAAGLVCCDLEGNPLQFTPDQIDPDTLAHHQPIIIGWPDYVEQLRSPLVDAIASQQAL